MSTETLQQQFEQALQQLCRSQTVLVTTHVHPDGDGIGSALALLHYLEAQGKQVRILLPSPVPEVLRFLPAAERIEQYRAPEPLPSVDTIVVVDTSEPHRLGALAEPVLASHATKVVFDHHLAPKPFADIYVVEPASSATGELLWRFLRCAGGPYRQREIAQALYAAIVTDTGSFAFSRVTAELHRTVAELLELGVNPEQMHEQLFSSWSLARMRLLGEALETLELYHDGRVALMVVPRELFLRLGARSEDIEGFAQYTLSVRGVQLGILAVELPDEPGVKLSFRSRGAVAVHELAAEFGGGGHEHAAGARVRTGSLLEVCHRVVERARAYLR